MSKKRGSIGLGITGTVFTAFLILKLTGSISWSWLWVTSPLWLPVTVTIILLTIAAIVAGIFKPKNK